MDLASDEQDIDPQEIVIQGFRNVRSRTNYRYRGTAMSTTDAMDIDDLQMLVHEYEGVLAHVASAFATIALIARSRATQNLPYEQLQKSMDYLCLVSTWMTCYLETLYMDIEDRIYFVHVERPLPDMKLRTIDDLEDDNQSNFFFWFHHFSTTIAIITLENPKFISRRRTNLLWRRGISCFFISYQVWNELRTNG